MKTAGNDDWNKAGVDSPTHWQVVFTWVMVWMRRLLVSADCIYLSWVQTLSFHGSSSSPGIFGSMSGRPIGQKLEE